LFSECIVPPFCMPSVPVVFILSKDRIFLTQYTILCIYEPLAR
jgi:hypothetical protein